MNKSFSLLIGILFHIQEALGGNSHIVIDLQELSEFCIETGNETEICELVLRNDELPHGYQLLERLFEGIIKGSASFYSEEMELDRPR